MEWIRITPKNLETEHICCAIAGNRDCGVAAKKAWLKERLKEGLVFLKADVRGKCFIEYLPAEMAWAPIEAEGYMFIDCFWVAGALKGHGYSDLLLKECIRDSKEKGKRGLCIVSSAGKKKKPFAIESGYLKHQGFVIADEAEPDFALWYLPFEKPADKKEKGEGTEGANPRFRVGAKHPGVKEKGFVLYYTHQCPFSEKYALLLEEAAKENGVPFRRIHISTREEAQNVPAPSAGWALFRDGEFLTNEILSPKKFADMLR